MLSKEVKQFLLLGVGNPLRSDDGVGPHIVEQIARKSLPGVVTRVSHQLDVELLEEAGRFEKILLVDASFLGEGMLFKKVLALENVQGASSHHLSAEFFLTLAKKLYHRDLNLYVCALRGRNFEMGQQLSPEMQKMVPKAIDEICAFLKEK